LLILERLMEEIRDEERRLNEKSTCSAESPYLRNVHEPLKGEDYLPCHYFDFIGGTSTGG
jgi:hypothetical protein